MKQVTIAVCTECGVQSPPIFISSQIKDQLENMGWKVSDTKYIPRAVCPECQKVHAVI